MVAFWDSSDTYWHPLSQWKINGFLTFLTCFAFSIYSTTWEASNISLSTQEMFSWIQIYDTGKVHKSFKCPNIVDIRTPSGIRMRRIKVLVEDIFEFLAEVRIYSCLDIRFHSLSSGSHLTYIIFHRWIFLNCTANRCVRRNPFLPYIISRTWNA